MTEREKMRAGLLYNPAEEELSRARLRCKTLCAAYNALPYPERERRAEELLRELLGAAGVSPHIEPPFWCDYGDGITAGDRFYMNHGGVILDGGGVAFGDDVMVGPQCGFHTACHPLVGRERAAGLEYAKPIRVGDRVWIGAGVQVMPGVSIGADTVIGGGSVVTRDIPAGVVAAGNPCRVLRKITDADRIQREGEDLL